MNKVYIVDIRCCVNANSENELSELLEKNEYYGEHKVVDVEGCYNVGDEVVYLDISKEQKTGIVKEVEIADNGRRLYLVTKCPYLRYGSEILGFKEDFKEELI